MLLGAATGSQTGNGLESKRGSELVAVVREVTDLRCDLHTSLALAVALHDEFDRGGLQSVLGSEVRRYKSRPVKNSLLGLGSDAIRHLQQLFQALLPQRLHTGAAVSSGSVKK